MSRARTVGLFVLITVLFGAAFPAIKRGVADVPPLLFAAARCYISGVLLLAFAVVGASTDHGKAAHNVPGFLQWVGYEVIPVNPNADEVLGRPAYDSLADVEEMVDIVQIFRPSAEVGEIVDQALERDDVQVIWMQPGIHDEAAATRAERGGLTTVLGRCMGVEYRRLNELPGDPRSGRRTKRS